MRGTGAGEQGRERDGRLRVLLPTDDAVAEHVTIQIGDGDDRAGAYGLEPEEGPLALLSRVHMTDKNDGTFIRTWSRPELVPANRVDLLGDRRPTAGVDADRNDRR